MTVKHKPVRTFRFDWSDLQILHTGWNATIRRSWNAPSQCTRRNTTALNIPPPTPTPLDEVSSARGCLALLLYRHWEGGGGRVLSGSGWNDRLIVSWPSPRFTGFVYGIAGLGTSRSHKRFPGSGTGTNKKKPTLHTYTHVRGGNELLISATVGSRCGDVFCSAFCSGLTTWSTGQGKHTHVHPPSNTFADSPVCRTRRYQELKGVAFPSPYGSCCFLIHETKRRTTF